MKLTEISTVVGVLETILKDLGKRPEEMEIKEWIETIQTTVLLRSVSEEEKQVDKTRDSELGTFAVVDTLGSDTVSKWGLFRMRKISRI